MSRNQPSQNPPNPCMFKPGDVVQLRSGGPPMTVEGVSADNGVWVLHCTWFTFNNGWENPTSEVFVEPALEPALVAVEAPPGS